MAKLATETRRKVGKMMADKKGKTIDSHGFIPSFSSKLAVSLSLLPYPLQLSTMATFPEVNSRKKKTTWTT